MSHKTTLDRRAFVGVAAGSIAAARLGLRKPVSSAKPVHSSSSFTDIKQINAGALSVGYAESGPADGPPVMLLHGWPYDINSYAVATALLAAKGYRVIVPHLRGYGSTRFLSGDAVRNGQQSAFAQDTIDLLDALGIQRAIIGGFDWGSRTAAIVGALWPERCKALVCVSGYLVVDRVANQEPLPPRAELGWWYQYYFATERGRHGYDRNRNEFNRLIWQIASPTWHFDDTTFARTAASFANPDHTDIVIHNYRWRLSLAEGEPRYDDLERRLTASTTVRVPTVTIASDFDGAAADGAAYARRFVGPHDHRILKGIGHNVPQEAPDAFANAIIAADRLG